MNFKNDHLCNFGYFLHRCNVKLKFNLIKIFTLLALNRNPNPLADHCLKKYRLLKTIFKKYSVCVKIVKKIKMSENFEINNQLGDPAVIAEMSREWNGQRRRTPIVYLDSDSEEDATMAPSSSSPAAAATAPPAPPAVPSSTPSIPLPAAPPLSLLAPPSTFAATLAASSPSSSASPSSPSISSSSSSPQQQQQQRQQRQHRREFQRDARPLVNSDALSPGEKYPIQKLKKINTRYGEKILVYFPRVKYILPNKFGREFLGQNIEVIPPNSLVYCYGGRQTNAFRSIISYIEPAQRNQHQQPQQQNEEQQQPPQSRPQRDFLCMICFSNERNTVVYPCKHFVACNVCTQQLVACAICRAPIERTEEVFI